MIYLDYTAGTPVREEVLKKFVETERRFKGNPNSNHPLGNAACQELERITTSIAKRLCISENEIIYSSGASEANNTAIKGLLHAPISLGKHIISTPLEHASVKGALSFMKKMGYMVDYVHIGSDGRIDIDDLYRLLKQDTAMVCISAVDSELGIIQPLDEIYEIVDNYSDCRIHVDATQAIGKIPFDFSRADTISFSAHKFYGLAGSGILCKKKNVELEPLIHGSGDTSSYRAGTPTISLDAALETALQLSLDEMTSNYDLVKIKNKRLRKALSKYKLVRFNSSEDGVPYILNISVKGVKGTSFQRALADRNICVSVKSACSSDGLPSESVMAVSNDRSNALASWRISLSHLTTDNEMTKFLEAFDSCYVELTK